MRRVHEMLLVLIVLLSRSVAVAQESPTPAQQPNVLFIAIDDLRPELGAFGSSQAITPNIDRLASQGTVFRRAFCQVAVCGASRASLMTGILPTPQRFVRFTARADREAPGAATLPQVFKQAGYTTISNGKIFHNPNDSNEQSWSEAAWRPEGGHARSHDPQTTQRLSKRGRGRIFESPDVADDAYPDGRIAAKTVKDLRKLKRQGKPFFLACGFVRPHLPFYAPKKYWDLYDRDKIQIADNRYRPKNAPGALRGSGEYRSYHLADYEVNSDAWHRMMRHGYLASTSYVDKLTGDVLDELDRLGLADNTIIVLWGDHGWHLGEHNFWGKHNTMFLAARVPLIVKVPGKAAGKTDAIVETSDIFPTLCRLAGLDVPGTVQGRSFVSVIDQPGASFREVGYCRFGPGDAVFTDRYAYTRYRGGRGEMLYDRQKDPAENVNVVNDPAYAEAATSMRTYLQARMQEAANAKIGKPENKQATKEKGMTQKKSKAKPSDAGKAVVGKAPGYEGDVPMPTRSNIAYGPHERHVFDFWQAEADKPTPLVFVIHGGGWTGGSKERLIRFADPEALMDAGISVVAINYRLLKYAKDVDPPVKAPMHDAARALQFVRSKANELNIDPDRIALAGGSAGACTSLWLAYHDDLADPTSDAPVARKSTRVVCAALRAPQTTLDPQQMVEWTPNSRYGGHAFGKESFAEFLKDRESILPWIAEYSPYALTSADDPPVCLFYAHPPAMGENQKDPTHTANFGIGLQRLCHKLNIACQVVYPGSPDQFDSPTDYLIHMLAPASAKYRTRSRTPGTGFMQ